MADNLVAIVTGGAQGLGAAISTALLKKGYKVCVADIQEEKGQQFVAEKQKIHGNDGVLFVRCDVTKETDLKNTFDVTLKAFKKVDVLVNNAGIILEQNPAKVFEINVMGVVNGCQVAIEYMGRSKGGKGGFVLNTASILGLIPYSALPVYTASKHAVIGFTRSYGMPCHLEKEGIIYAALCPCYTDTDILDKFGTCSLKQGLDVRGHPGVMSPEYVAQGAIKLLEDRINGATLAVEKELGYVYVGCPEELKDIAME